MKGVQIFLFVAAAVLLQLHSAAAQQSPQVPADSAPSGYDEPPAVPAVESEPSTDSDLSLQEQCRGICANNYGICMQNALSDSEICRYSGMDDQTCQDLLEADNTYCVQQLKECLSHFPLKKETSG